MHLSALDKARVFRSAYLSGLEDAPLTILDVGSAIVDPTQHSNRDAMTNPRWTLTGMDIEPGLNVDVAVADPYDWREVESGSVDVVTCSEVFEHAEYFWVTILEIARVLRPRGLAFITSPSPGPLHRYPVDCWRFYDDGLPAVARWGGLTVLDAQVQWMPVYRKGMQWRDASIVLQRPDQVACGGRDGPSTKLGGEDGAEAAAHRRRFRLPSPDAVDTRQRHPDPRGQERLRRPGAGARSRGRPRAEGTGGAASGP